MTHGLASINNKSTELFFGGFIAFRKIKQYNDINIALSKLDVKHRPLGR